MTPVAAAADNVAGSVVAASVPQPPPAQPPVVEPPPVAAVPAAPPAPQPVADSVAAPGPVPSPGATPSEPTAPVAAAAAGGSGEGAGGTKLTTPDIAGAVDKAVDRLRTHLTVGEIVAGLGAVIILGISWLTFGFIFGHYGTWPSQLVMLLCVALLGALVLQNAHIHDFGPNYRLIVTGICFALGLLATLSFLQGFRLLFNGLSFDIGGLTWWAGAWVSVIGGFLVWREGR
jgi:hypothetical protein